MASRDPWFDNAKMTLVTLAVVGHAWGLLPHSTTNDRVFDFLYVWHMPAFIMLSGYLSQRFDWTPARIASLVTTLLVPYVLFEAGLAWFEIWLGWPPREDLYLVPIWPLWYLLTLAAWRLLAPALRRIPPALAVGVAVAVSLVGGMVDVDVLALSRVTGMLPFFVIGLVATPELVERVRTPQAQLLGLGFLAAAWVLVRHLDTWASTEFLLWQGYDALGVSDARGVVVRGALLVLGAGCALGALSLVPRVGGWFTRMGAATMVVFLAHGFVIRAVDAAGFGDWAAGHPDAGAVLVVLGAVGLSLALATERSVRLLTPLVDPVGWRRQQLAADRDPAPSATPSRLSR